MRLPELSEYEKKEITALIANRIREKRLLDMIAAYASPSRTNVKTDDKINGLVSDIPTYISDAYSGRSFGDFKRRI